MKLVVNAQGHEHKGAGTVADLLRELGTKPGRAAVMVNDEVIPSARHADVRLSEGDRVEVLAFAGGG